MPCHPYYSHSRYIISPLIKLPNGHLLKKKFKNVYICHAYCDTVLGLMYYPSLDLQLKVVDKFASGDPGGQYQFVQFLPQVPSSLSSQLIAFIPCMELNECLPTSFSASYLPSR